MSAIDTEVLLARTYLSRVAEPANLAVWDLVDRLGPVEAATAIRRGVAGAAVTRATQARRDDVDPELDLESAQRHAIALIVPESPQWPHFAFAALGATAARRIATWAAGDRAPRAGGELVPPLALWVKGPAELASLGTRAVAVVGARAATAYGDHVAAELGYGLSSEQIAVVSGGAFGIDAAAHRGALAAGGLTVLVAAGGLDRPYPAAHARLFDEIGRCGLLISESPPGCAPQRHRFLSRNRLIASFGSATVVVEAGRRSGSLNTASHARALGRLVLAVPGPVTSALSLGCHDLIRRPEEPATLVTAAADVVEVLGIGALAPAEIEPQDRSAPPPTSAITPPATTPPTAPASDTRAQRNGSDLDLLDPVARQVFDGLPARAAVSEDTLSKRSGVPLPEVLTAIVALRLAGLILSGPDGHRIDPAWRRRRLMT